MAHNGLPFDVAIIGAGVIGSAIARELARYELRCVLIEAGTDVGAGTSKANTAILHTGFDAKPNTLERRLLRRGYELLGQYAAEVSIPLERTGAVLVAWNSEQLKALPGIRERAHQNGVTDVALIAAEELRRLEPHLGPGALGGLIVPGESVICTFTTPLAYATQAVLNGVVLQVNSKVKAIIPQHGDTYRISTSAGTLVSHYVVNAAGLYSDEIDRMMGHADFTVTPRRGEEIVYDKSARSLIDLIILPVPTKETKGVLISPTVYGNVLLGPTAEDLMDKTNTSTSYSGLQSLQEKGRHVLPALMDYEVTTTYAGLRAATEHSDYQIRLHADQRYVCVGGIRSTGLTASLGIAEYVVELLAEAGLSLKHKATFKAANMPYVGEALERPYQCDAAIAQNPDNGRIMCYCERVTRGELLAATRAPIPARDLDGLKRRTRATFGRCQGNYCLAQVVGLLAEETGQPATRLLGLEDGRGSDRR